MEVMIMMCAEMVVVVMRVMGMMMELVLRWWWLRIVNAICNNYMQIEEESQFTQTHWCLWKNRKNGKRENSIDDQDEDTPIPTE
jgi:hypothetical protein